MLTPLGNGELLIYCEEILSIFIDLSFDFGIYSLEYTHTWDGSVQVGVAEQLEQRGKLGLTGTHAPNLAFKSSF